MTGVKWLRKQAFWLHFLFLLFLIGLAFSYAMFQGGFVSWFLFYSILPMGIYALFLTFYPLHLFRAERKLNRSTLHAGELLTVTITITRKSIFPLFYVVIEDQLPDKLTMKANNIAANHPGSRALFFPFLKRSMSYSYEIHSLPRGSYTLNEIVVKTGDPFGFMQKDRSFTVESSLLVYPAFQQIHWQPFDRLNSGRRSTHPRASQDFTTVVGIREYIEGDRLSLLHWKASAKRNQLVTKEFEQQTSKNAVLFLNGNVRKGEKNNALLFEKLIIVSASLTHSLLKSNCELGMAAVGKKYMKVPLQGGKEQERRIFSFLAKADLDFHSSFPAVLQRDITRFPREAVFFVVTSSLSKELLQTLERVQANNRQLVFMYVRFAHVLTSEEQGALRKLEKYGVTVYEIAGEDIEAELKKGEIRYAAGRAKTF